jgi:hypothetical protein
MPIYSRPGAELPAPHPAFLPHGTEISMPDLNGNPNAAARSTAPGGLPVRPRADHLGVLRMLWTSDFGPRTSDFK